MIARGISLALATISTACSPAPKIADGQNDFNAISISEKSIQLAHGNRRRSFENCGSVSEYCFQSRGALLVFPKHCPESLVSFYADDPRFTFLGYVHGFLTVQPKDRTDLVFIYSEHYGLGALYWDYGGDDSFVDRGANLGVDMVAAEKFKFTPASSNFSCLPDAKGVAPE
jgi:hypothetical protein